MIKENKQFRYHENQMSASANPVWNITGYVGKGFYANILGVCSTDYSNDCAVKMAIVTRGSLFKTQERMDAVENEIFILKKIQHPNIIRVIDSGWSTELQNTRFSLVSDASKRTENMFPAIVMERCRGGSLRDLIKIHKRLSEQKVIGIIRQIVSALVYLESMDIVHRDIKNENVLDHGDETYRLCDFGFSTIGPTKTTRRKGTPYYMAPEIWNDDEIGHPADMWALGIMVHWLLYGQPTFEAKSTTEIEPKIKAGSFTFSEQPSIGALGKDFIKKLHVVNQKERMTAIEASQHPWLQPELEALI